VPAVWRDATWVLRVASAAGEWASEGGPGTARGDACDLRAEWGDVWQSTVVSRPARPRPPSQPPTRGTADARRQAPGAGGPIVSTQSGDAPVVRPASEPGAADASDPAESDLGGRPDVPRGESAVVVSGGGPGSVLPAGAGVAARVDPGFPAHAQGRGGGAPTPPALPRPDIPQRPRQRIPRRSLSPLFARGGDETEHDPRRGPRRERPHRIILPLAEGRWDSWATVSVGFGAPASSAELHAVLQPPQVTLSTGLSLPR